VLLFGPSVHELAGSVASVPVATAWAHRPALAWVVAATAVALGPLGLACPKVAGVALVAELWAGATVVQVAGAALWVRALVAGAAAA
jgi:hypothetical protein